MVRDENLKFMKNRDVYNSDYFSFTLSMASVNAVRSDRPFCPWGKELGSSPAALANCFEGPCVDIFHFSGPADETQAPILPGHGQGQFATGCPVPLPHLSAHQEEAQVRTALAVTDVMRCSDYDMGM